MPRLIEIDDRRPIDWASGKRMPACEDDLEPCMRCGKLHAITWVVEDDSKKLWHVGSTCAQHLFGGWTPEKGEKKSAMASLRKKEDEMMEAEKARLVEVIASRVVPREMATPSLRETLSSGVELWDVEGEGVWVRKDWGETLESPRVKDMFKSTFIRALVREAADGVEGEAGMLSSAKGVVEYRLLSEAKG